MHSAQAVAFPDRAERMEPDWSVLCDGATVEGSEHPIIKNISCRMSPLGITAIMGANGAGKSMLLKTIAGLSRLTAGNVQIHPQFAGKCSLVFQKPVLLRRSVRANLAHALRVARIAPAERRSKMRMLLDIAGLSGLESRPARSLSGGEQQRLQISRALAADPKLLFAAGQRARRARFQARQTGDIEEHPHFASPLGRGYPRDAKRVGQIRPDRSS